MPQWQFKLFEFEVKDVVDNNSDNQFSQGRDNKQFVVQMFGLDASGKTACIYVNNFKPFFYVKVDESWNNSTLTQFIAQIKEEIGKYYEFSLCKWRFVKHRKLYGFDDSKEHLFVELKFNNMAALNKVKYLWYTNNDKWSDRKLNPDGYEFNETKTELYEANIPPLLRLFHIKNISPSGWIALLHGKYKQHSKLNTTCDYEFSILYL